MNEERVLQTFLELAAISSPSKREGKVALYCKRVLEQAGCAVYIDESAAITGSDTGNLVAYLPGTVPGKLFITAHMDTVEPCDDIKPVVRDGVVYSDGTTVLGGDDKVGIAAALETVLALVEQGGDYPTVGVLLTVQEEIGLNGARAVADDLFDGELALVCDGDLSPNVVTIGAAGQYHFTFEFVGKAAHAGVSPQDGISAIQMASDAIAHMKLGRLDESSTANVALVQGESAINVVPPLCTVKGECRAMTASRLDEIRASIEAVASEAASRYGGEVHSKWEHVVDGYAIEADDPAIQMVFRAVRQLGLKPQTDTTCGATDGNFFAVKGARPVIIGTGMSNIHSTSEYVHVRDLCDTARLLIAICRVFATT